MIDLAAIEAARQRIAPHIRKTPTLRYAQLSTGAPQGLDVTLKLELLQAAGSFKARGAINRLLTLSDRQLGRGIVTASGGNHGQAASVAISMTRQRTDVARSCRIPTSALRTGIGDRQTLVEKGFSGALIEAIPSFGGTCSLEPLPLASNAPVSHSTNRPNGSATENVQIRPGLRQ